MTTSPTSPAYLEPNHVFPAPWTYQIELHSDDDKDSFVAITDASGYEFASYEGDCDGVHQIVESAHTMEAAHRLLVVARLALRALDGLEWNYETVQHQAYLSLAEVIADAERT